MRELIEQTDYALTFLPPYSPTMNPIDEVFLKIKFYARILLENPTDCLNLESIDTQKNESIATVTSPNCYKYFINDNGQIIRLFHLICKISSLIYKVSNLICKVSNLECKTCIVRATSMFAFVSRNVHYLRSSLRILRSCCFYYFFKYLYTLVYFFYINKLLLSMIFVFILNIILSKKKVICINHK